MQFSGDFLLIVSLCHLALVGLVQLRLLIGMNRIRRSDSLPEPEGALPSLSIIVAARNEERDIEAGLRSLLALHYAPLQLIVINDRSTDRTGDIVNRLATQDPRLAVLHLESLPANWLGKNHALQRGAEMATGEFVLFTDADVVFQPSALAAAVAYARDQSIDHLAALPAVSMPTLLLESFATVFSGLFLSYFRPWRASHPKSPAHIGIGAFNLVRRAAYEQVGRHEPIRMRPDDDLKLGKLMKTAGFRQELIVAASGVRVPWYATVKEVIIGLEKNTLAGVDYRPTILFGACVAILVVYFWPFVAMLVVPGLARWPYVAAVLILLGSAAKTAHDGGGRPWCVIWYPLTLVLFVYIVARNTLLTYWRGGIRWRDHHYPLSELRDNKI